MNACMHLQGTNSAVSLVGFLPKYAEPLKITDLDLMKELNTSNHHTHQYDTDKVVLRRGEPFRVRFQASRKLSKARHALNIEFRRGRRSSFYKGSRFESRIERTSARDWEWKGRVEKVEGLEVEVAVEIPVDAPIGEYSIIAEAVDLKTGRQENFTAAQNVVILFNPWNEGNISYLWLHNCVLHLLHTCVHVLYMGLV